MRLSTRLLLPLLAAVSAVMLVYAFWAVRQREATLTQEARTETRAYARSLGLAIEAAFRDPVRKDAQEIIDRLSREETVYAVLVYDVDGTPEYLSAPLQAGDAASREAILRVLASGEPAEFERDIAGVHVFSVVRPLEDVLGKVIGAFEVTQPLSFLQAEIARTRQRFLLNTATLLVAVTGVMLLLLRRLVSRPLARLITGARALGAGELGHRVSADPGPTELEQLAQEFNRMADRLQAAHAGLVREAEERVQLERRLRETEKLAAVGNIAAGLAHEIGAPLHVIRGRAELMLRRDTLGVAEQRNLKIIVEQIARITQIVRNLLDFARRREPSMETVDVCDVLRGVVELMEPELDRNRIAFAWEGATSAWVRGDRNLFNQVFINLVVNAIQALGQREADRRLTLSVAEDQRAGTVVLEVRDNGPGIPTDLAATVFEPFVTTKASGEGTGLGLAVARTIVEDHGGRIEVHDGDGGGAVFRVALPVSQAPATADV